LKMRTSRLNIRVLVFYLWYSRQLVNANYRPILEKIPMYS
jgi:hypothetical protein